MENGPLPNRVKRKEITDKLWRDSNKKNRELRLSGPCPDCGKPKKSMGYRCRACASRIRHAQRVEDKLCVRCGLPALEGYTKCEKHLKDSRRYSNRKKAKGICVYCAAPAQEGHICCPKHVGSQQIANQKYQQKFAGLCRYCRTSPPESGKGGCRPCLDEVARKTREKKAERKSKGLCAYCGDPAVAGATNCEKCYYKNVANSLGITTDGWELLADIMKRQGYRCIYTNEVLTPGINSSIDHKIAVSAGGTSAADNLQWTTKDANQLKYRFTEEKFFSMVAMVAKHRLNMK